MSRSIEKQIETMRSRKSPIRRIVALCRLAEAAANVGKSTAVLKAAVSEALSVQDPSRDSLLDTVVDTQAKLGRFSEALTTTLQLKDPEARGKCYDAILRRAQHRANAFVVVKCRDGIKAAKAQMSLEEARSFEDYLSLEDC